MNCNRWVKFLQAATGIIIALVSAMSFAACKQRQYDIRIKVEICGLYCLSDPDSFQIGDPYRFYYFSSQNSRQTATLVSGEILPVAAAYSILDCPQMQSSWIECRGDKLVTVETSLVYVSGGNVEKQYIDQDGEYLFTGKAYSTANINPLYFELTLYIGEEGIEDEKV